MLALYPNFCLWCLIFLFLFRCQDPPIPALRIQRPLEIDLARAPKIRHPLATYRTMVLSAFRKHLFRWFSLRPRRWVHQQFCEPFRTNQRHYTTICMSFGAHWYSLVCIQTIALESECSRIGMYLRLWPDVRMSDTTVCPLRWLMNTAFEWTIVHLSDEINVTTLNVSECFESHSTKLTECSTFDGAINERKSRFPTNNGATRFIRSTSKLRFLQKRISRKFECFQCQLTHWMK